MNKDEQQRPIARWVILERVNKWRELRFPPSFPPICYAPPLISCPVEREIIKLEKVQLIRWLREEPGSSKR